MRLEDLPVEDCPFCGSEMYISYSYYSGQHWIKHAEEDRACVLHTMDGIALDQKKPKTAAKKVKLWNERAGANNGNN